jgi:hypothetical protein
VLEASGLTSPNPRQPLQVTGSDAIHAAHPDIPELELEADPTDRSDSWSSGFCFQEGAYSETGQSMSLHLAVPAFSCASF